MNKLIFQSFGSGSSGNCYYIGTYSSGILIDAGISARSTRQHLRALGLDFDKIWGVFITHDHADHVRSAGKLCEKFHIPIYSTKQVREGIERNPCVKPKPSTSYRAIERNTNIQVSDYTVTPFSIPHDSTDCVGYHINIHGLNITIATDVGSVTDELAEYVQQSDLLIIEANYDDEMLRTGPYPAYLKQRISCGTGHLSNAKCGDFLAKNYTPQLKKAFLCHLSEANNTPELAFETVSRALESSQAIDKEQFSLEVLPRKEASKLFIIKDSIT